ncbi:hypothetical protein H0H93_011754 [Arthromyces matolae]|nr:hypothetical protein H0H93_011754 [Arthromyces matolae]
MLPRHLQSLVVRNAARCRSRALLSQPSTVVYPTSFRIPITAGFHTTSRRQNELPKSPFQTFVEVLRDELRKNRELQDNVKQLQGDVDKFQDSEAMKKAKAAYERARLQSSIKENPKLRAAAEELKKAGVKVGDAVSEALKTMEESDIMRAISRASAAVSSTIEKSTEPIRKTEAYKALSETLVDALDDSGSAKHAGFEEKEARRLRRQKRLAKAGKGDGLGPASKRVAADPEAGEALVLHKDSPRQERWNRLKEENPIFRRFVEMRQAYDESEHPVVSTMRSVTSSIGSFFDENEMAQVMRMMKAFDPDFNRESFERDLREYIVPEVVDAYLSADQEALKAWCGEATYNVLWATMEHYLRQGLVSDSKVLDIRQVDVSDAKMLENDVPVFLVQFSTQEVLMFRDAKTREITVGADDKVEQCVYVAAITRVEEELSNELTGGWKVVEVSVFVFIFQGFDSISSISLDGEKERESISINKSICNFTSCYLVIHIISADIRSCTQSPLFPPRFSSFLLGVLEDGPNGFVPSFAVYLHPERFTSYFSVDLCARTSHRDGRLVI